MASLVDLFATGAVGGVARGSSDDDVRRALGSPSDRSISRDPIIWKYDAVELTLRDGHVELLQVELDQPLPPFLDADGLNSETSVRAFERLLDQKRIPHEPYPPLTFEPDQIAISSGPGRAVAVFADGKLAAISSLTA